VLGLADGESFVTEPCTVPDADASDCVVAPDGFCVVAEPDASPLTVDCVWFELAPCDIVEDGEAALSVLAAPALPDTLVEDCDVSPLTLPVAVVDDCSVVTP
jgi:hypothetical protein